MLHRRRVQLGQVRVISSLFRLCFCDAGVAVVLTVAANGRIQLDRVTESSFAVLLISRINRPPCVSACSPWRAAQNR